MEITRGNDTDDLYIVICAVEAYPFPIPKWPNDRVMWYPVCFTLNSRLHIMPLEPQDVHFTRQTTELH